MGLTKWRDFSSFQNWGDKIRQRTKEKDLYYPNWCDYASKNYEIVVIKDVNYLVPENKDLYIFNAFMSGWSNATGSAIALNVISPSFTIIALYLGAVEQQNTISRDFNIPIKIPAGSQLTINTAGNPFYFYNAIGFLVPITEK
jgi:hypothetical protein